MKKVLLASTILLATPAFAQSYTVGLQGADWTTLSSAPTGAAPADAFEPAEVALPVTESDWLISTGDQLTTFPVVTGKFLKGAGRERKIRTNCEPSTAKQKDNILGFGIAVFGHLHQGYGPTGWDENSTFTTLRTAPSSTCAGGPLNASNYMEPALLQPLPTGVTASVRAQDQAVYYTEGIQGDVISDTWLRRGMQFILGASPTNFNDATRRLAYAAGGLTYPGSPVTPAGVKGWSCSLNDGTPVAVSDTTAQMQGDTGVHITARARYLRGPAGEDPFGGNCTGTVAAPANITSELHAPGCWDRYNLTAPDGRAHFWYRSRKSDNSVTDACPVTVPATSGHAVSDYAKVPTGEFKNIFTTTGFADYGIMYLSSDRMDPALTVTPGCTNDPVTKADSCSLSPCRSIGPNFCPGETLHADYTFGWFSNTFDKMQRECLGITVRGVAPTDGPAECNAGQVDRTHGLLTTGASPNSAYSGGCATISACYNSVPGNTQRYNPVPAGTRVNATIKHKHGG